MWSYWHASLWRLPMKLTDLAPLLPAINNGWTFAAFVVGVATYIYVNRRGTS